jgi:hypothetical protein
MSKSAFDCPNASLSSFDVIRVGSVGANLRVRPGSAQSPAFVAVVETRRATSLQIRCAARLEPNAVNLRAEGRKQS